MTLRGSLRVISKYQSWVRSVTCMYTNHVSFEFYRSLDVYSYFIHRDYIRAQPQRFFMF
jgi:hypothetical protein